MAIQIITTNTELRGVKGQGQHMINIIDKHKGRPSLKEVLCNPINGNLPIFVFSVTGKTRGGKSLLLNLMIKYLENQGRPEWKSGVVPPVFNWKGGIDSITKGVWISPKVYLTRNNLGKKVGILLLDNQGLFDGEETDGQCIAMSGISTAISHLQMFNVMNKIYTNDLESIWRHLISDSVEDVAEDKELPKCTLMVIVRDYMGSEEGCGLEEGQAYISKEQHRGTNDHKEMWKSLKKSFHNLKCLLLPNPGPQVLKRPFGESADLSVVDKDFLEELDQFFKVVFAPENLNVSDLTNSLTGNQIYNMLSKFNGKIANESLSFLNVFTEHGNQDKFDKLKGLFESRLNCYKGNLPAARQVMEDELRSAEKRFRGNSAREFLSKLREVMTENINSLVKDWILESYKVRVCENYVEETHRQEWPTVHQRLNSLVGTQMEISLMKDFITVKAAEHYYERLRIELQEEFNRSCADKDLEKLYGYDDVYVANKFKKNVDFQKYRCDAIWLKEQLSLKQDVQNKLLERVAALTKLGVDWLQKARKQQYEYFQFFTWISAGKNDCHWNQINKQDKKRLQELISYAMFNKPLDNLSEEQINVLQPVEDQIIKKSVYDPIRMTCVFVIYKDENKDTISPVFKVESTNGTVFIDTQSRVYTCWDDYEKNNKLPDCVCCYPLRGEYNKNSGFQIVFAESPAAGIGKKILNGIDVAGKVIALGAVGCLGAVAAIPTLPVALLVGGTVAAVGTGGWGLGRAITKIVDKVYHEQSVGAGDIINTVGNTLAIGTVGASAAATFLINFGREALVVQSVAQGLGTLTTLVLSTDNELEAFTVLGKVIDISVKMLFYFNSKTPEETIETIRQAYELTNSVPRHEVLKTLIRANCITSTLENSEKPSIEYFVSEGVKSLVLNLLKFGDSKALTLETIFLNNTENDQMAKKMHQLYCDLKQESNQIILALSEILNGGPSLLRKAVETATQREKTIFSLILRNLIYSIFAKMHKANRLFVSHKGHHLKSYWGVQFHPVKEVFVEIDSVAHGWNSTNIADCLVNQPNKSVLLFLKKILNYVCDPTVQNWNLKEIVKCLALNWSFITESFDKGLKDLETQIEQHEHMSCFDITDFVEKNSNQDSLGASLLEKVLDKAEFVFDISVIKSETKVIIMPAWEGLLEGLYFYCISGNTKGIAAKGLVEQLIAVSHGGKLNSGYIEYQSDGVTIVKPHTYCHTSPTYYVYRNTMGDHECGLIYQDK